MRPPGCVIANALVLTVVALLGSSGAARAQAPIKIVMPTPAGGAGDIVARLLSEQVSQAQGRSIVVEEPAWRRYDHRH
jgi:tripartite-type tricarboxylate transporter receptor subunit TctC